MIFSVKTGKDDAQITTSLKTANSVCRGAGDSHLPRSMRARSPHGLFSPAAVPNANGREAKLREPTGTAHHRWGFRAMHDQLTQLDRGRCIAPAPYYFCFLNKIQRI